MSGSGPPSSPGSPGSDPTAPDPTAPDPLLVEQIAGRADAIRGRIASMTDRVVRIVCVTKGHPPVVAASAFAAGFVDLGENYAQELRDKAPLIGPGASGATGAPSWHFVGRLQTNKVRLVADVVSLWQSVDRIDLATRIAGRAPGSSVLVQVDLAGIEGRGGCRLEDAGAIVERCRELGLDVRGLMGVAPPGPPEDARPGFRRLDALAADLGLDERSMGMSGDFEVAVQEGATMLRLGAALVGPRPPRTSP